MFWGLCIEQHRKSWDTRREMWNQSVTVGADISHGTAMYNNEYNHWGASTIPSFYRKNEIMWYQSLPYYVNSIRWPVNTGTQRFFVSTSTHIHHHRQPNFSFYKACPLSFYNSPSSQLLSIWQSRKLAVLHAKKKLRNGWTTCQRHLHGEYSVCCKIHMLCTSWR